MKKEDLNRGLKNYYDRQKSIDKKELPPFDAFFDDGKPVPKRKILPLIYRIAATLLLLLGLGLVLKQLNKKEVVPQTTAALSTDYFLPRSDYIWEWESPTQTLLETQTNTLQTLKNQ